MSYKIAFYTGTSSNLFTALQQWGVRIWTFGKYSHCELIDDRGSDNPYDWIWIGATTRDPGVTSMRRIEFKPEHWDVFDLPDVDFKGAIEWTIANLGKKYDWLGIWLSQFLPWGINNPNKFFCSEFNIAQLQRTSILCDDDRDPQQYSPNGVYRKLKQIGALTKWQK